MRSSRPSARAMRRERASDGFKVSRIDVMAGGGLPGQFPPVAVAGKEGLRKFSE
jgi:hypothetical protein